MERQGIEALCTVYQRGSLESERLEGTFDGWEKRYIRFYQAQRWL